MFESLKRESKSLRAGTPGSRFQDHYRRRQGRRRSRIRKPLIITAGLLIVAAGIFFLPAPGPGFLIIFLGGGLLAEESLLAARVLDWLEVRLRRVAGWGLGVWSGASLPLRALIVLVALAGAAAAAWISYRLLFGG